MPHGVTDGRGDLGVGKRASVPRPGPEENRSPATTMLQRIGRYESLERIAAGGQGTVYRARDTVLDRKE